MAKLILIAITAGTTLFIMFLLMSVGKSEDELNKAIGALSIWMGGLYLGYLYRYESSR